MRTFSVSIKDHLMAGLRSSKGNRRTDKEESSNRTSPGLVRAFNIRKTDHGLAPYNPVIQPFSDKVIVANGLAVNWPGPQLLKGKKHMFLVDRKRLFIVNTYDWTLFELDNLVSYPSSSANFTVKVGHQWQLIDFWDTWILTNGQTNIFHANFDLMTGGTDNIYINNNFRVNAGCDFNGRSWMGGFDPDYFHVEQVAGEWDTFFEGWADDVGSTIDESIYTGLGANFVMWSTIGGGDMFQMFSLLDAERGYITSAYGGNKPLIFDYLKRNECGRMPMPWQGSVRHMKPIGKFVIVYGDDGVSVLAPSGPVVGLIDLHIDQGIHNTGAVGGNENEHLWLDRSGALWYINAELAVERLDFREFFTDLLGTEVIISYSSGERQFYISNGSRSFLLSISTDRGGVRFFLSEIGQQVTSVVDYDGGVIGMGTSEEMMADDATLKRMEIVTDTIDFGFREMKTATQVVVHGDVKNAPSGEDYPTIQAGFGYKYKMKDDFSYSTLKPINDNGSVMARVTAPDLRVRIKSSDFRDFHIDDATVHYQIPDKRFTRGPNTRDI